MRKRRALVAAALVLSVAGCGQAPGPRAAVAAYLKQVDRVERSLSTPLSTVTATGNQFAEEEGTRGSLTDESTSSQEHALVAALARIAVLRRHLAAIPTPPAAAHLRSLLLQIIDGQSRQTRELAQLVVFLPRYAAALRPLAPATRRLELALARQSAPGSAGVAAADAARVAALRRFQASVDGMLRRLRRLRPPPIQKPSYAGEIASLGGMSKSAGRLAVVLQSGLGGNVRQLLSEFDRAATLNQTVAAQRAQIAAIRAYDGQSTSLAKLTQAAELERLRLQNTLS